MIAVDVGNSRIKFGLFEDQVADAVSQHPVCSKFLAVSLSSADLPWDQIDRFLHSDVPHSGFNRQIVVASVNPKGLSRLLAEWPQDRWPLPRLVAANAELPIVNLTHAPEKVGIDRLLKALSANKLRTVGQPIAVVDSGTATTVDWINDKGEFAGGAILPGLDLSSKALHSHTAQLPLIDWSRQSDVSPSAVGKDTVEAMRSGLFWGQVGAIRELIRRMSQENGQDSPQVLVTGGGGLSLTKYLDRAVYRPVLTLEGLVLAANATFSR